MRRANALSLRIHAPSRGLVTRWPSDTADEWFGQGKVSVVAQNVRYENGVIAAAPGYQRVSNATPPATPFQHLHQGKLLADQWLTDPSTLAADSTPLVGVTADSIYKLDRSFDSATGVYSVAPTLLFTGSAADKGAPWFTADNFDKILFAQRNNVPQTWTPTDSVSYELPGLSTSDKLWDGVEVFFGHTLLWRGSKLKWSDVDDFTNYIPVGSTVASVVLTTSADASQPAANGTVTLSITTDPTTFGLTVGQFMRIDLPPYYSFYTVTAVTSTTVTLQLMDLTGALAAGTNNIPSGTQVSTLDANEAGEATVAGARNNGEILQVKVLGDYAYIFKARSISSMQYVGAGSGIFYLHTEVTDEGLLAARGLVNLGDGRLVFLGHKELYQYSGGPTPQAVCQQASRQMYSELDRSRLDEIFLFHNEFSKEVWLYYPVTGGNKVLIWNYFENTATFDEVLAALTGVTAMTAADWPQDVPWFAMSLTWAEMDPTTAWGDLAQGSRDRVPLMASGDDQLQIFGLNYDKNGTAYTALSETMDYDLGDPDVFKYLDVVVLALQTADNPAGLLYVQAGCKDSLNQDLTWSDPVAVDIAEVAAGNNSPVKVNPGGSGRYVRLRFYSQDAGVAWRVSGFEVHTRPGNTY